MRDDSDEDIPDLSVKIEPELVVKVEYDRSINEAARSVDRALEKSRVSKESCLQRATRLKTEISKSQQDIYAKFKGWSSFSSADVMAECNRKFSVIF